QTLVSAFGFLSERMAKLAIPSHPTIAEAIATRLASATAKAQLRSSKAQRETLLDLLARVHAEAPLASAARAGLSKVEMWATEDGPVCAANATDVYVPSDFNPPPIGGGVALFKTGGDGLRRKLLVALGAREFLAAAFVERLFLRGYSTLDPAKQRVAL